MDLARAHGMPSLKESFRTSSWKDLHDDLRRVAIGEAPTESVIASLDIRIAANAAEAAEISQGSPGAEIAVQSNDLRCRVAEALPRPPMPTNVATGKPNIAMLRDGIAGWVGDQVVVRKNVTAWRRGTGNARVANGEKGRITAVSAKVVIVEIAGNKISMGREVAREALALGGVQTGDSAQGQTWNRAVVVLSGMETREWLYSAATSSLSAGRLTDISVIIQR